MIVCVCRNIRSSDVHKAACDGARCAKDVFKRHGTCAQCAICVRDMQQMIGEVRDGIQIAAE